MNSDSPFSKHFGTNYVPVPHELDQLAQIIAQRQVFVDDYRAKLEELDRQRKALEAAMNAHTEYIDHHRALAQAVRRIPSDVLALIFETFLSLFPAHCSPHPAVTISHVCRGWRDLALETPRLWTQVALSLPHISRLDANWKGSWQKALEVCRDRALSFVTRAKNHPLDFFLNASDPDKFFCHRISQETTPSNETFYIPILDVAERCSGSDWSKISLHLRLNRFFPLSIVFLIIATMSPRNTSTLVLDIACSDGEQLSEDGWGAIGALVDLRSAPLTSLTMRMTPRDIGRVGATWNALTDLTIGPPDDIASFGIKNALDILSRTSNIVHCCIEFSPYASVETAHNHRITLSKLRTLTIRQTMPQVSFAYALELPSLTSLSFADVACIGPLPGERACTVATFVQRYGHQLLDVALQYQCVRQASLLAILKGMPNIEVLKLATHMRRIRVPGPEVMEAAESPALLEPFIPRFVPPVSDTVGAEKGLSRECLCPRLRELVLGLREPTDGVRSDILALVRARRRPDGLTGVRRIDHLTVGFDHSSGLEGLRKDLEQLDVDTSGVVTKLRSTEVVTIDRSYEAL